MILGIGTDIVEISRIERSINNPSFLKKCYTQQEIEYCTRKGAVSFAGLFAAKEAVSKALGTGFLGFSPADIRISRNKSGQPMVELSDKVKTPPNSQIMLTIAHEKTFATATAILVSLPVL
ncbi:MAG: holo-ACP synthase [Defluviitaleaceae bacterium]|nr:holo-ACP synthase [Defluviitaleaceae bacterium]